MDSKRIWGKIFSNIFLCRKTEKREVQRGSCSRDWEILCVFPSPLHSLRFPSPPFLPPTRYAPILPFSPFLLSCPFVVFFNSILRLPSWTTRFEQASRVRSLHNISHPVFYFPRGGREGRGVGFLCEKLEICCGACTLARLASLWVARYF